jgi:single-strand DNA-binding protein
MPDFQPSPYTPESTVTLRGNIGKQDPELRYTADGKAVCNFSLGVTDRYKDDQGTWKSKDTVWYKVSVWNDDAEHVKESFRAGDRVILEGYFKGTTSREYEGKTYQDNEITANEVGASLKYATVEIARIERTTARSEPSMADAGGPGF